MVITGAMASKPDKMEDEKKVVADTEKEKECGKEGERTRTNDTLVETPPTQSHEEEPMAQGPNNERDGNTKAGQNEDDEEPLLGFKSPANQAEETSATRTAIGEITR